VGVAYTPDVVFEHVPERPKSYLRFRNRKAEFVSLLLSKWGLRSPPDHPMCVEPGVAARSVRPMPVHRPDERPNLLVFGVGHSGTTVVTRMLIRLGWNAGPADEEYAEHVSIRELNEIAWRTGRLDRERARELVRQLPAPWVIKDPRFVNTIEQWLHVFEEFRPCLLWLVRDLDEVRRSYRRRGEGPRVRGKTVEETFRMAEQAYRRWPWTKLRVDYEQVRAAVSVFDVNGRSRHARA
jgi:hypothetical protein